ncbi:MAG: ABC transporter substrate-binding protein [Deltaproteobacteria bacterium]|nr:ABC transporter substrate-binding protein [Deltaproteobacteria bacterium]
MIFCFGSFFLCSCGDDKKTTDLERQVEQLSAENSRLKSEISDIKGTAGVASGEGKIYKIAGSFAMTGPTSDMGIPYTKGVEDYVRYVNDEKLLGNDKIECFLKDDGYQTEAAKRNFEEFIEQEIVLYLNYSTGSTLALKNDFEEEKIAVIPASFHAGNIEGTNYVFLPIVSYSDQIIALGEYIEANHQGGTPKVALFIHPSAFGRGPVDVLQKAVEAGLKIEIVEVFEHGNDLDYTALLQRLLSKKVQYVICQTVQPPVSTLLNSAQGLGIIAGTYGEEDKITFLGLHYAGGPDLIGLAGSAAENYYWTTSYKLTSMKGEGTTAQLDLAERYGRDEKTANSQSYTNGIQVVQIAVEAMRRVKTKGKDISRQTIHEELEAMNGFNAYYPLTTVGPVTYSKDDHQGVDFLQLYRVRDGVFQPVGAPFSSEYVEKIK